MYSEGLFYENIVLGVDKIKEIFDKFLPLAERKSINQYYTVDDSQIIKTFFSIEDFEKDYSKKYKYIALNLTDRKGRRVRIGQRKDFIEVFLTFDDKRTLTIFKKFLEEDIGLKTIVEGETSLRSWCTETRRYLKKEISLGLIGKVRERFFKKISSSKDYFTETFTIETSDNKKIFVDFEKFASNITSNYVTFQYDCRPKARDEYVPFLIVNILWQWIEITICLQEDKLPQIFSEFENILNIQLLSKTAIPRSVFIAHVFNGWEEKFVSKLAHFFQLMNFNVATGKMYSPEPVDEKVKRLIEKQGIFIGIITKDIEVKDGRILPSIWLLQEPIIALLKNKKTILIKEKEVTAKLGYFDKLDTIPLEKDKLDEVMLKITEGLVNLGFFI